MFGAIEAIKDKITKRPEIGDIVANGIESGEEDNSVTLRSYTGSPSAPKGNQSTVSSAGSSSASRGNKPSESTVSPAKSSSEPKSNQSTVSPARSSSAPKGNQSIVSPVGSSSVTRGNGSPRLGTKAVRRVKKIFGVRAEGSKEKEPKNLRSAQTMTIGDIQSELKKAITKKLPNNVIYLVRNNRETINKEINSGKNSEIIDLVDKAADVKASKGKAAYQMAEDKDNEEFLEIVDNARKRLAELKNRQSKSKLEKVDEAHEEQPVNAGQFYQNLFPDFFDEFNEEESHEGIENLKLEEFISQLRGSVDNNTVNNIISVIADNLELINQELAGDKKDEIEKLLKEAADVKDDKGNSVPQILDSPEKLTKEEKGVLKLFNSLKNIMPSALEATDEEGETLQDIAKTIGCKGTELHSLGGKDSQSSEDEDALNSLLESGDPEKKPLNLPLSPVRPSLPDSDRDSGIDSPGSSPKKEGMESPQSSRRNGISSSIESLNSGDDEEISGPQEEKKIEPKLQEEFLPAAKLLPLLNKERPKGPSGRRTPSKPLVKPAPVVTPTCDAEIQKEQEQTQASATRVTLLPQEGEPALDAEKAQDQVTEEPKVIKPEEEKENTLRVKQKPAANRNSDKDISLKKQSNDRSFCFAATTISTLGAIACFATASIYIMSAKKANPVFSTSSIAVIGALFLIGIGFAATAGITWCLTLLP